jgi:hypothetical protein
LWITIIVILVLAYMWSPDFLLSIPMFLYIPFVYKLFFVRGDPNIIFWGLLYQWATVSIQLIYCNVLGIPLNDLFRNSVFPTELLAYTDLLSIIGLYFFSLGIFVVIRKIKVIIPEKVWDLYDPKKMIQVYVVISVIISASQAAIWAFPSLVQYLFFLFYLKWGFFVVTFIGVFKRDAEMKIFLYVVIAFEFILGLSSFFASSFTTILLFSIISYSAVRQKITYQKGVLFVILGALLFHMAVLWTASKGRYRSYLNQGQATQTVKVSSEDARRKLLELIFTVDAQTYNNAIEDMVNRIGYIQYFAAAIRFVPAKRPFENGKVYWTAISHYLVPRFINPDKPVLDDSKHTNEYTGLGVSGKERATSFSLGSFADAYIDFGPIFMFVPIFLFGTLFGYFYKYLYKRGIWGLVLTGPFFLLINIYGADTAKALGFLLIYFLVIAIINKSLIKFIDPMMRRKVTI